VLNASPAPRWSLLDVLVYAQVLSFPVVVRLCMLPRFPFALLGSVHLSSSIHASYPPSLCSQRTVTITAQVTDFEYHKRGTIAVVRCTVVDSTPSATSALKDKVLWFAEHRMLFFHSQSSNPSTTNAKTSPSPPVPPEQSPDIALGLTLGQTVGLLLTLVVLSLL
jgi:hypothetical protein